MSQRCQVWRLLALLPVLWLGGCAVLPGDTDPLPAPALPDVIGGPLEVQATVAMRSPRERPQQYLVALKAAAGRAELALLSAQGVPLYQATVRQGTLSVRTQAGSPAELPASRLLVYLALVYGDPARLQETIAGQGYTLRDSAGGRDYGSSGASEEFSVRYVGAAPGFAEAVLFDRQRQIEMFFSNLEWRHALPE